MSLDDLLSQSPGDLTLECSDGCLQVHKTFLGVASGVFGNAFNNEASPCTSMKVEGSVEAWRCVLEMLYPIFPRPELTFGRIATMLRVMHMYDFGPFLKESLSYLHKHFPDALSPDPASPCYLLTWLGLADDLQLEELRSLCMSKVREMAHGRRSEAALLAAPTQAPTRVPAPPKPTSCPRGHSALYAFAPGQQLHCPAWCPSCKAWVCCINAASVPGAYGEVHFGTAARAAARGTSELGSCQACSRAVQRAPPLEEVRWFRSDTPQLAEGIRALSRQALEELLASVVAATGGSYCNAVRPEGGAAAGDGRGASYMQQ